MPLPKVEWEKRSCTVEVRVETIGEKKKIRGYAAMFNEWSDPIMGYFREIIRRGAFKKTIQENDIRALFNHDPNYVLGRNKNGTLELVEDRKGLAIAIDPPNTIWARDLVESIKRGDIDQMSFQFRTVKDKWNEEDKNNITRELLEAKLYDISPVTFPQYPKTTVAVRSKVEGLINSAEPTPAGHSGGNKKVKKEPSLATHSRKVELERKFIKSKGDSNE